MTASSLPKEASDHDEVSMQQSQSLPLSNSLKDLKNLRCQLYSAAEYFELSYTNDDQKQIVAETLKDYAIKALVNTVDHLGSVTYKVNDLLDNKVDEVSGTEFQVSCIEQRMRTCQLYIDHEGISQQSLVMNTPKYHKQYILPVGETMHRANESNCQGCSLKDVEVWQAFRNAVRDTIRGIPTSSTRESLRASFRKGRPLSPSPQPPRHSATLSSTCTMTTKDLEKQTVSLHRFPHMQSGSMSSTPNTPNPSRPTTPSSAAAKPRHPSEPWKSQSMRIQPEKEIHKDVEKILSKSRRFLRALLGRHKPKKDEMLYTYLDEY